MDAALLVDSNAEISLRPEQQCLSIVASKPSGTRTSCHDGHNLMTSKICCTLRGSSGLQLICAALNISKILKLRFKCLSTTQAAHNQQPRLDHRLASVKVLCKRHIASFVFLRPS